MALKIPRSWLRSIYKSPYLVYPAGILAIVLIYTLIFLLLQDNFHLPGGRSDFLTALYWVVITMTTTGYGDIYPTTVIGKMFSLLVVLTGLSILFAIVLPLMVTPIMDRLMRRPRSRVPEWVGDHVIIAGYNAIVETLIVELTERGIPFVVIDRSPEDSTEAPAPRPRCHPRRRDRRGRARQRRHPPGFLPDRQRGRRPERRHRAHGFPGVGLQDHRAGRPAGHGPLPRVCRRRLRGLSQADTGHEHRPDRDLLDQLRALERRRPRRQRENLPAAGVPG